MNDKEIYITHANRTAIGSLLGSLSQMPAADLGAHLIKNILVESKLDSSHFDEVILGQVITGGMGQNPARQAAINAGMPQKLIASTINMVCGSGLKAILMGYQAIAAGEANLIIAGGQENMSLGQHGACIRKGTKFGELKLQDQMQTDGLRDAFNDIAMGITAENIAKQFKITREEQDEFAVKSHLKATKASESGSFKNEIVPIELLKAKQKIIFDKDESIRNDTSLELLKKLKPVFLSEEGTVTAGNASSINDGAACVLICSAKALLKHNLKPLVRIVSFGACGVDPLIMGIAAAPAAQLALQKANWSVNDLDVIEVNEAFAAQAIYVNRTMNWDIDKVNMNGGAIALGHPIGASGARVLVSLIHQMKTKNLRKGLATLCIGGGMGIAICVEKV